MNSSLRCCNWKLHNSSPNAGWVSSSFCFHDIYNSVGSKKGQWSLPTGKHCSSTYSFHQQHLTTLFLSFFFCFVLLKLQFFFLQSYEIFQAIGFLNSLLSGITNWPLPSSLQYIVLFILLSLARSSSDAGRIPLLLFAPSTLVVVLTVSVLRSEEDINREHAVLIPGNTKFYLATFSSIGLLKMDLGCSLSPHYYMAWWLWGLNSPSKAHSR